LTISVVPGPPAVVRAIAAYPVWSGSTGNIVHEPISFALTDTYGNRLAGDTVSLNASGGSTIGSSKRTTDSSGTVVVSDWRLGNAVGALYVLTASLGAVEDSVLARAAAGSAASIEVRSGAGQQVAIGLPVPVSPEIIVRDSAGNFVYDADVLWSDRPAGESQCANVSIGFTPMPCAWVPPKRAGVDSLHISAGAARTVVTASVVEPPASIDFMSPHGDTTFTIGTAAAESVTVRLRLADGAPAAGYHVSIGSDVLDRAAVHTDADGMVRAAWNLRHVGVDTMRLSVDGVPGAEKQIIGIVTGPIRFANIGAGAAHTCATSWVSDTGQSFLYCWGSNADGELGDGTTVAQRTTPTIALATSPAVYSLGFTSPAGGGSHTCVADEHTVIDYISYNMPTLLCWGANGAGQLGRTGTDARRPDTTMESAGNPAAGTRHTCAVSIVTTTYQAGLHIIGGPAADRALCWGDNHFGELGDGSTIGRDHPAPVDTTVLGTKIASIAAGDDFSCAVNTSGGAFCWGKNDRGQLGDGTSTNRSVPVAVTGLPVRARAVVAGGSHACALGEDGLAYCWGANNAGQLGDGAFVSRATAAPVRAIGQVTALAAGSQHTCALTSSGAAYCWGSNAHGQLGAGSSLAFIATPAQVSGAFAFATLAADGEHTCGILASSDPIQGGAAYCWGANAHGELGDGTTTDRSQPAAVAPYRP